MPRNDNKPSTESEERMPQRNHGGLDPEDPKNSDVDEEDFEPQRVRNRVTDESEEEELADEDIMEELDEDEELGEGPDA
jgi:hypothetical protein